MNILAKLDKAYAKNPDPDYISASLKNPLTTFIRCDKVTRELWESLPEDSEICFWVVRAHCWDGNLDIDDPYLRKTKDSWTDITGDFSGRRNLGTGFAVIAYSSRYMGDPSCL